MKILVRCNYYDTIFIGVIACGISCVCELYCLYLHKVFGVIQQLIIQTNLRYSVFIKQLIHYNINITVIFLYLLFNYSSKKKIIIITIKQINRSNYIFFAQFLFV